MRSYALIPSTDTTSPQGPSPAVRLPRTRERVETPLRPPPLRPRRHITDPPPLLKPSPLQPSTKFPLREGSWTPPGIIQDVRFHPKLNFGHFWALLTLDLLQCQEPWRWGRRRRARRNCQERRTKENKENNSIKPRQAERKQQRKTLGEGQTIWSVFL